MVEEDHGTEIYCKDDLLPTSCRLGVHRCGEPGDVLSIKVSDDGGVGGIVLVSKRWGTWRLYADGQEGDVDIEKSDCGVGDSGRDCLVLGHTVTWEEKVGGEGV